MVADPKDIVDHISESPDDKIPLAVCAIALAALDMDGISMERYVHHLDTLSEDVGKRHLDLLKAGSQDDLETRLAALKHVISDQHAYIGDTQSYEHLDNANMIRVIDRAEGIPITLSILYIHAARALGWEIDGLNIPGHFVCRLEMGGQRLIFDPFNNCKILEAADLRLLVKKAMGERAELSAAYFEPAKNREILIRLQNNVKHRLIEAEDYAAALEIVQRMQAIDPKEFRLFLDAGVLSAKIEHTGAAITALESYLDAVPKGRKWDGDRHDAMLLLNELRGRLN